MDTARVVPVDEVARWLEANGATNLWTVDGETRLGRAVSLPCLGADLATAFREVGGFVVLVGQDVAIDAGLDAFMFDDDGGRAFAMRWSTDGEDELWVMTEDLLAEAALREANDAHVAC